MSNTPPTEGIAASHGTAFAVTLASWSTVLVTAIVALTLIASHSPATGGLAFMLLAPITVMFGARWVGAAPDLARVLLRSIALHVAAPMLPAVLFGLSRMSDPGFSGHGGIFLLLIIFIPMCAVAGAVVGSIAGVTAWGVVRWLGRQAR